ncbi:hypothetical protein A2738_00300 [Candidatus Nomurabacteria bacterium RIFCSPHIGHO2_01_FULL_42_15]|uniref:Uncharacterized protein n=1 Tax=Candidatus Nomurabacteria bacterium RIFCSPHIGHO2_01_FULL_42_15 TaxID=1801742 RepID=A0A1F6VGN6_9BACT|nr:MAG: hypothetical protein A2738_00300 [Candidatus Nomurabacteria bacterium RIFCSPHIGHO2_01_FULL_42_15]OGI92903.1 MAG: hypothetical protein A3A99_02560 [Candidatus Nomurabacteria bacterium RIFCSPLOWO2_01_FULL_41_18]
MSSKENPFNLTEAEMEESRKIANSPEMKAMMDRAREQDILEEAERSRKFEEAKKLLKEVETLERRIIEIDTKLAELGHPRIK